jgi:hypothetical protein
MGGLIELSPIKGGRELCRHAGLPELARFGHFTSPDRRWERIEF